MENSAGRHSLLTQLSLAGDIQLHLILDKCSVKSEKKQKKKGKEESKKVSLMKDMT